MAQNIVATTDSPALTVPQMLRDPLFIPALMLSGLDQLFVAEKILRPAGKPEGGTVVYYESTPLFAGSSSEYVEEFGEIPVAVGQLGTPKSVRARKRALGVTISQEMQDRNAVDLVNTQISQARNTIVSDFDATFWTALLAASANTFAATTVWASTTHLRKDVLAARKLILDQKAGFMPDTLVLNPTNANDIMTSAEMTQVYTGNVADQNPLLTGRINFPFVGLDVMQTYAVPAGTAVLVQKGRVGGYADERPLQATPLYKWKPEAETWRSDLLRTTAIFIDQPKAATIITGI
jgi:hypothetical protein